MIGCLLNMIPLFNVAKFGFLLWMLLPQTNGAKYLYQRYVVEAAQKFFSSKKREEDAQISKIDKDFVPICTEDVRIEVAE